MGTTAPYGKTMVFTGASFSTRTNLNARITDLGGSLFLGSNKQKRNTHG